MSSWVLWPLKLVVAYYTLRFGSDPKAALLPDHFPVCSLITALLSELAKSVIIEYFNSRYLLVFLIAWSPGNDAKKPCDTEQKGENLSFISTGVAKVCFLSLEHKFTLNHSFS